MEEVKPVPIRHCTPINQGRNSRMKWQGIVPALIFLASPALAEDALPSPIGTPDAALIDAAAPVADAPEQGGLFPSDHAFPGFIGFVSNPTRSFDPRSLTQLWPMFISAWTGAFGPVPSGDFQAYGPGLSVALSDRLCVGLSNGGYVVGHHRREREGWVNLAGFGQYTLIRDVDNQFLVTGGLIWEAPTGSKDIFQGSGPAYLSPYATVGKEFGCYHVLATTGYNFAAGSGRVVADTYYATLHLDRRTFGWLYPVVEFNGAWTFAEVDLGRARRRFFLDFDRWDTTGSSITVAPGVNAILVQDRLEFGACYETPIWTKRDFNFNVLVVKMILRF
jgi:hypothetical protein